MSSLVKCPACGRQVSDNAAACPGCAEPISLANLNGGRINLRDPVHVAGVVVSAVIILGIALWVFGVTTGRI